MEERIWVYLQRDGDSVAEESLLAISAASEWAGEVSARLEGVWFGPDLPSFPGAPDRVLQVLGAVTEAPDIASIHGAAMEFLLEKEKPTLVVFPSTTVGQDLASWLGAWSGAGALVGARHIRRLDGRLVATRLEFDGRVAVDYVLEGSPAVVALEQGVGERSDGPPASPQVVPVELPGAQWGSRVRVISASRSARRLDLRTARTIVAVGAGVGGADGFEKARELAALLGAEIGATRAAVDAGWVGHERQIGQTGVKVKPDLYVACGISGAVQHRVGMLDSGTIVSINIDPQAPIFRFSHYCVLGDVREVLPKLLELLRR